jgi:hypothetical protein
MTLESLHRTLEANGARRLSSGRPIWALRKSLWPPFRRGEALHARQRAVLDAIRPLPWQMFLNGGHGDCPWPKAARDTWLVPPNEGSRHLLAGRLDGGSWKLYLAPHALDPDLLPDTFHGDPVDIEEFVEGHCVPVLVDAWRENIEWRIVVEPAAVPGLAAA